jgi:hypothetical protein
MMKRRFTLIALLGMVLFAQGQRRYAAASVLSSGQWAKVSVDHQGVYKVPASLLKNAGLTSGMPSANIRIFGTGGGVLPESNQPITTDDLPELAIEMNDGGDGVFDGNDFFLFYAPGPDQWMFNPVTRQFEFRKNPYSDQSYYFINFGNTPGKRITEMPVAVNPSTVVVEFDEHYRHELDSINFLRSGKEWYGESFGTQNGRLSSRDFNLNFSGAVVGGDFTFHSEVVGRSFEQPNRMQVLLNGQLLFEHSTPPLVGSLLEPTANMSRKSVNGKLAGNGLAVGYRLNGGSASAEVWLNWFELHFRRTLDLQGLTQLAFRDLKSVAASRTASFSIRNGTGFAVWLVSDPLLPGKLKTSLSGSDLRFANETSQLQEYIAFNPAQLEAPVLLGPVANQNLHGVGQPNMVIVADKSMASEAKRLADFHAQKDGLTSVVATPEQIYNEFSSGSPDPTAIRNFLKMLFDRAGNNASVKPKYLLLFGGASYVYKEKASNRKNLVPSYQSESSLDPLTSYVTDDYFGYLDDNEDINQNLPAPLLDLGIGRIPARTVLQARQAVDKIIQYHGKASLGSWRNDITLVADDEDFNIHLNDAEFHASLIATASPVWNLKKIYLDAFKQESGTGGSRYPEVNAAISRKMNDGTLIWNYSGHGSSSRLAQEAILDKEMVSSWENASRLPLIITATCDFAPFDDPTQLSIGEDLLVGRSNGAIGLMTTTRLVFASSNRIINNHFFKYLLKRDNTNKYPRLGTALMDSKNFTVVNSGDYINARKFTMLGDPAMKLAMPEYSVRSTTINGRPIAKASDTLRSLNRYTIEGEVLTPAGLLASDFNGDVYPEIFDKPTVLKTLGNDPQSRVVNFNSLQNLLYKGKVNATNGKFSFSFIVPKDINFQFGQARVSYYADNGTNDAQGIDENLVVGGLGNQVPNDNAGPSIKGYLNNLQFINGGIVNETPLLLVHLADPSGINLSGNGIGHEITAVIDGNYRETIVLNDYFKASSATSLNGTIQFRLPQLSEGNHKILLKAWDVFNNSSEYTLLCKVIKQDTIKVTRLFNYPNPVYNSTTFSFSLEGPSAGAKADLMILTLEGQALRSFTKAINEAGLRSIEIEWNGRDEKGNRLGRGVYIYQLTIMSKTGKITRKVQKLIIL